MPIGRLDENPAVTGKLVDPETLPKLGQLNQHEAVPAYATALTYNLPASSTAFQMPAALASSILVDSGPNNRQGAALPQLSPNGRTSGAAPGHVAPQPAMVDPPFQLPTDHGFLISGGRP